MYDNERDKELLERPYKKIQAAEDLVNSNALLDLYVTLYKKKYKAEPIFPVTREHLNLIKSFAQSTGPRAYGLLEHFFEMKDDWYHKQAHSLACLMNNLNKVNASYSQRVAAHKPSGLMHINTFCDACHAYFVLEVPMNHDMNKTRRCGPCTKENRPVKTTSKEERRIAVLQMGNAFPELPNGPTEEHKKELLNKLNPQ